MWYSRIAIKVELLFSLGSSNSGHSSRTYSLSESDCESVTSDGSWVITPAPTFRGPKSGQPVCDVFHPLEDLLIEHPTMSVYHQVKSSNSNVESEEERGSQGNENERTLVLHHDHQRSMNCNRELVLLQNRQRQQLAMHMQLPLTVQQYPTYKDLPPGKPPRVSRKALQRHNANSLRSNKSRVYRVQKCCFKAGRRRCWACNFNSDSWTWHTHPSDQHSLYSCITQSSLFIFIIITQELFMTKHFIQQIEDMSTQTFLSHQLSSTSVIDLSTSNNYRFPCTLVLDGMWKANLWLMKS